MKSLFFAVFSILACMVYAQLHGNWYHDLLGHNPYVALPPSGERNMVNFGATALEHDTVYQTQNLPLLANPKSVVVDLAVLKLVLELVTGLSDANTKIAELSSKITNVEFQSNYKIQALKEKVDAFTCTCKADDATTINKIPSSCQDLKDVGNTKSGLYSIFVSKQVETVYCDFTISGTGLQKSIGYQNLKSMPAYFYVQKTKIFSAANTPIPFEREVLNKGAAMDLTTGKFKAPVTGTYFFSFTGLVYYPVSTKTLHDFSVSLFKNGQRIGTSQLNEVGPMAHDYYLSPVTFQSTITLTAGDLVWLEAGIVNTGSLYDSTDTRYTHFNGWLLEEEIVITL